MYNYRLEDYTKIKELIFSEYSQVWKSPFFYIGFWGFLNKMWIRDPAGNILYETSDEISWHEKLLHILPELCHQHTEDRKFKNGIVKMLSNVAAFTSMKLTETSCWKMGIRSLVFQPCHSFTYRWLNISGKPILITKYKKTKTIAETSNFKNHRFFFLKKTFAVV